MLIFFVMPYYIIVWIKHTLPKFVIDFPPWDSNELHSQCVPCSHCSYCFPQTLARISLLNCAFHSWCSDTFSNCEHSTTGLSNLLTFTTAEWLVRCLRNTEGSLSLEVVIGCYVLQIHTNCMFESCAFPQFYSF